MAYTKQFLIDCYVSRYEVLGLEAVESLYKLASNFYDTVSKEKFRQYACVDAEAIRVYKNKLADR